MSAGDASDEPPISWDEAREVVTVVLTAVAALLLLAPVVGFIDGRYAWSLGDDIAELTRNAAPSTGLFVLLAAAIVATTSPDDVVPALRRAVAIVALVVVVFGAAAAIVELTRPSPVGVAGRLQSVMGRSGPGALLAGTARWLCLRVVPFPGARS